jgi:hypothetical protein
MIINAIISEFTSTLVQWRKCTPVPCATRPWIEREFTMVGCLAAPVELSSGGKYRKVTRTWRNVITKRNAKYPTL